jgi:hypothetical protein
MRYISVISGVVAALTFAAIASAGSFEDKMQVTVGGAEYMLTGHIIKIDKDAYWIRKASSDVAMTHQRWAERHGPLKEILLVEKSRSDGLILWDEPSKYHRDRTVLEANATRCH